MEFKQTDIVNSKMGDYSTRLSTNGHLNGIKINNNEGRQETMSGFWSDKPDTVEGMMLDTNAAEIDTEEAPEILSYLPDLRGKDVLEIGSGIGRFTGHLAAATKSLHTVDFIQAFVDKNRENNGHFQHVSFECNDAMKIHPPSGLTSLDVVFTNWLMMYLSDDEVQMLAKRVLSWLKVGGYFFVRESCFHPSGNMPRNSGNPTFYRDPSKYCELFQVITNENGPLFEGGHEFELQFATSVKTYIKRKKNPNQICWLYRKVSRNAPPLQRTQTLQEFLDGDQYTRRGILKYENIYGYNFISVGGPKKAQELLANLQLKADEYVLDVGAGVGGSAFLMAKEYGVHVLAMDLSSNMVTIGMQRRVKESADSNTSSGRILLDRIAFEISDINKRDYQSEAFDCIHSRETVLHLKDKANLLAKFYRWLKPGGRLLMTDYCRGEKAEDSHSREYRKYTQTRGYYPATVTEYEKLLRQAGFTQVTAVDRTADFAAILQEELTSLQRSERSFINEFSQYEFDQAIQGWRSKQRFAAEGDMVWGYFLARKE